MRDFLLTQSSRAAENRATSATVPSVPGVPAVSPSCKLSASLRLCSSALKTYLATAFALLLTLSANALPLAWRADWPDCKPVEKLVHRGTDVELLPAWYIYGTPAASTNWTLTTYVQTNCVGQWFGPLPGAFFSHSNDVGAASYGVMVRAQAPDGSVNYTAFARLRMLDSPGYTPGSLPLPVPVLDFANVSVLNPPWPSAIASATNALDQSVSSRLSQTFRDSTNYTDSAIAAASTNYATRAELDAGWWSEWSVIPSNINSRLIVAWSDVPLYSDHEGWYIADDRGDIVTGTKGDRNSSQITWSIESDYTPINITATRHRVAAPVPTKPEDIGAADTNTVAGIAADLSTNYYTRAQTDDAIDALAAYYITANAAGDAFATVAALTNATAYYSGGALRTPTRNDYAVVLADESHGGAEWRYIYAVHEGATAGQWEAQYPIETNDYEALSNKPQINGVELSGNQSAATLGLATPSTVASATNALDQSWSSRLSQSSRASTNYTDHAISTADTSYPRFTSATNLNQSVQYLTSAPNNILTIELPAGSAATKDWIVYAYFGTETSLALPAANWWMADESYTNAIPASTPTAFYFSQVADGIYTISRQELKTITITNP